MPAPLLAFVLVGKMRNTRTHIRLTAAKGFPFDDYRSVHRFLCDYFKLECADLPGHSLVWDIRDVLFRDNRRLVGFLNNEEEE